MILSARRIRCCRGFYSTTLLEAQTSCGPFSLRVREWKHTGAQNGEFDAVTKQDVCSSRPCLTDRRSLCFSQTVRLEFRKTMFVTSVARLLILGECVLPTDNHTRPILTRCHSHLQYGTLIPCRCVWPVECASTPYGRNRHRMAEFHTSRPVTSGGSLVIQ
jgi:hypothetical protein